MNFKMQDLQLSNYNCYYGRLKPDEVEQMFRNRACRNGLYLVYQNMFDSVTFILSIYFENQIRHYQIQTCKNKRVSLGNSPEFSNLIDLIEYLKINGVNNGMVINPEFESNRFKNTDTIGYLFISAHDLQTAVQKELNRRNNQGFVDFFYWQECEKEVLKDIHLSQEWFVKNIKKSETERLFQDYGKFDGKFLLRSNLFKNHKLSLCYENIIYHYKILWNDQRYSIKGSIDGGFKYLAQLIDYYARNCGILKCKLIMPYNNNLNKKYFCDTNELYKAFILGNEELLSDYRLAKPNNSFTSLMLKILPSLPSAVIENKIVDGNNSILLKGYYYTKKSKIDIAIKVLKTNFKTDEYNLVSSLNHSNIVKIIESFNNTKDDFLNNSVLIFEYAQNGSLECFLKKCPNIKLDFVINLLIQIGQAMVYLTSKKIVHRDIAARNVLLFDNNFAKLCDFGMAKRLEDDSNFYFNDQDKLWPVKWYPPETYKQRKFNEKTEVYSFGILIWEILSNGNKPYDDLKIFTMVDIELFFEKLEKEVVKLKKPEKCLSIHNLMNACISIDYNLRPKFVDILENLNTEHKNLRLNIF